MLFKTILTKTGKTGFISEDISNDHKPEIEKERLRIEQTGGSIIKDEEENGPFRVYVKDRNYPGLAISRSLGDFMAKSVGVICEPEIQIKSIEYACKYFVIASDGVWDYLSGDDIINIITPYYYQKDPEGAAYAIVQEAMKIWDDNETERDDISVIVSFIGNDNNHSGKRLMLGNNRITV